MIPTCGLTAESLANSEHGAALIATTVDTLREQVFNAVAAAGAKGMTDRELQGLLKLKGNTQRPRRWELWKAGRIRLAHDSDANVVYRRVGTRNKQLVWVVGQEAVCQTCGRAYTKTSLTGYDGTQEQ